MQWIMYVDGPKVGGVQCIARPGASKFGGDHVSPGLNGGCANLRLHAITHLITRAISAAAELFF